MNNTPSIIIFGLLSLIPAIIWLVFMFRRDNINKKVMFFIFLGGIAAVIPLFALQYLWTTPPEIVNSYSSAIAVFFQTHADFAFLNYGNWIQTVFDSAIGPALKVLLDFMNSINALNFLSIAESSWKLYYLAPAYFFFAMLEEIFKQWILRHEDRKYLIVKTINDSIKYSIVAGLGFSFAENILYFQNAWGSGAFMSTYIFRILFTAAGHMAFSGIFGYYYGISKFAITFKRAEAIEGKKLVFAGFLSKLFGFHSSETFRDQLILKGLVIAMALHGIFNTSVQFSEVFRPALAIAILLIVGIYIYCFILMKRKAGNLVLAADISSGQVSTIAKRDQDVILELTGMWFKEKRYVDVIHICERLLERDPNNTVIKLFKEKAMEQAQGDTVGGKILKTLFPDKKIEDKSMLVNYKSQTPQDFQQTEAFQKFKTEEEKKKEAETTYKLDVK